MNLLRRACSSLRGSDIMPPPVSAAGLTESPRHYAWTAGCRTPEPIMLPLDGLLKAAEKGGEGRIATRLVQPQQDFAEQPDADASAGVPPRPELGHLHANAACGGLKPQP